MFRVIIRLSLDNDVGTWVRNEIKKILPSFGIWYSSKTGTFEANAVSLVQATDGVAAVFDILKKMSPSVGLDHVWIYVDKVADIDAEPSQFVSIAASS